LSKRRAVSLLQVSYLLLVILDYCTVFATLALLAEMCRIGDFKGGAVHSAYLRKGMSYQCHDISLAIWRISMNEWLDAAADLCALTTFRIPQ